MLLKRLDNMDILVDDLGTMAKFYNEVLGFEFRLPFKLEDGWAVISAGNMELVMIEAGARGEHAAPRTTPAQDPMGSESPAGIDSFAFEVEDLAEASAELERRGLDSWVGDPIKSEWYHYRGFHDPEGNLLYITVPLLNR